MIILNEAFVDTCRAWISDRNLIIHQGREVDIENWGVTYIEFNRADGTGAYSDRIMCRFGEEVDIVFIKVTHEHVPF